MSVTRYDPDHRGKMLEWHVGKYVLFSDYEQDVKELTSERDAHAAVAKKHAARIRQLEDAIARIETNTHP
jgi:hypothetical protein